MKKLLLFFGVIIVFFGCSFEYPVIPELGLTTIEETASWVYENIEAVVDITREESWQSPEETYLRGAGDCEDSAVLFMYLVHEQLGVDKDRIEFVIATESFDEKFRNHGFAAVDTVWYDPVNMRRVVPREVYEEIWSKFAYRSYTWAMLMSY